MFIGVRLGIPNGVGGGLGPAPGAIVLSAANLPENSAQGTAIGNLSTINTTGTASFTLTDSAGNKIQLAGTNNVNVQAGSVEADYETATTFTFTVSVSGVTPAIPPTTFTIFVQDVPEGGAAGLAFDYSNPDAYPWVFW